MSEPRREEAENEREAGYEEGKRAALLAMLRHVFGELGAGDPEAGRARWVIERQETIAQLRRVCADHGDNDWEDDLHLGDVVEKHLGNHLTEEERYHNGIDGMGEDA